MVSNSEIDQTWKSGGTFTVEQAASLMAGIDPIKIEFEPLPPHFRDQKSDTAENGEISTVYACFQLLQHAVNNRELEAKIIYSARPREGDGDKTGTDEKIAWKYEWFDSSKDDIGKQDIIVCDIPDWSRTTVRRDHLETWLIGIVHNDKFFNTRSDTFTGSRSFMNPDHLRYSPELAMAVTAWETLESENEVTQEVIEEWIKERANDIPKLLNVSGAMSDRISKVVNWNTAGRPRKK